MSECDCSIAKESANCCGELEEAEEVGDGGSILSDNFADLRVRECELVHEPFVAFRFFQWIEVGALKVFDQGEREQRLVVDRSDDGRNFRPAQ